MRNVQGGGRSLVTAPHGCRGPLTVTRILSSFNTYRYTQKQVVPRDSLVKYIFPRVPPPRWSVCPCVKAWRRGGVWWHCVILTVHYQDSITGHGTPTPLAVCVCVCSHLHSGHVRSLSSLHVNTRPATHTC